MLVRGYHGTQLSVDTKAGDEPVTEADHAANALIVARLREAFPDDVVLSEEIPDTGERLGKPRVWMVDPIDGTRDFIAGDSGFVVMIGLAIDGRPAVGAVGHPLTGRCTAASSASARGARTRPASATATAHVDAVAAARHPAGRVEVAPHGAHRRRQAGAPDHRRDERRQHRPQDRPRVRGARATSTSTRAGARRSGTPAARRRSWLGAGGRMTDVDGKPLVYDQPDLYNRRGLVASNGPLHDFVIATVAPHRRACREGPRPRRLAAGDHHARTRGTIGHCTDERVSRSSPIASIRFHSSSKFADTVISLTGNARSPRSIQKPPAPREKSPVTRVEAEAHQVGDVEPALDPLEVSGRACAPGRRIRFEMPTCGLPPMPRAAEPVDRRPSLRAA